jgi:ATP phosphoribosyltransferase regulatory subunit HisZ
LGAWAKTDSGVEFDFHELRRTAQTGMTSSGVTRFDADQVLNHTEAGVGARYDHYEYDKEKHVALTKWDRRMKEIITGEAVNNVIDFPTSGRAA